MREPGGNGLQNVKFLLSRKLEINYISITAPITLRFDEFGGSTAIKGKGSTTLPKVTRRKIARRQT